MDITEYILDAEDLGGYKDGEFEHILDDIKEFYHLEYSSYEPGVEDWAILSNETGKMCMIHLKLKLMFSNLEDFSFLPIKLVILHFEEYGDEIWSIDPTHFGKNSDSKFFWHTDVIDIDCFSTQDLFYATV